MEKVRVNGQKLERIEYKDEGIQPLDEDEDETALEDTSGLMEGLENRGVGTIRGRKSC